MLNGDSGESSELPGDVGLAESILFWVDYQFPIDELFPHIPKLSPQFPNSWP